MQKVCVICGKPLPKRHRLYCSEECAEEGEKRRARSAYAGRERPGVYHWAVCQDCGVSYYGHIKTKRCPSCQYKANQETDAEYRRRAAAGLARKLGSTDNCEKCGNPYIVESGNQRYCKKCAREAVADNVRAHNREYNRKHYSPKENPEGNKKLKERRRLNEREQICATCGKVFATRTNSVYCSPECRKQGQKAYILAYDKQRAEKRSAQQKARWAAMTEEERKESNRRQRERYAARKLRKEQENKTE